MPRDEQTEKLSWHATLYFQSYQLCFCLSSSFILSECSHSFINSAALFLGCHLHERLCFHYKNAMFCLENILKVMFWKHGINATVTVLPLSRIKHWNPLSLWYSSFSWLESNIPQPVYQCPLGVHTIYYQTGICTTLHLRCVPGTGGLVGLGRTFTAGATVTVVFMVTPPGGVISA